MPDGCIEWDGMAQYSSADLDLNNPGNSLDAQLRLADANTVNIRQFNGNSTGKQKMNKTQLAAEGTTSHTRSGYQRRKENQQQQQQKPVGLADR